MRKGQLAFGVGVWLLLLVAVAAYLPGLGGPFLLDDFHNLQPLAIYGGVNDVDDVLRFVFGAGGDSFSRSFARLTFLLDDYFWPSFSSGFKFNNLMIHLLCVCVLALVLIKVSHIVGQNNARLFVFIVICLWALAPAQVSSVLYVVQRMTLLMTLGVLTTLYFYLCFRVAASAWQRWLSFGLAGICFVLACLSKENALIALVLVPFVDVCLYRDRPKWLVALLSLSVLTFICLFIYSAIDHIAIYDGRIFSAGDRFLTQGSVLFNYIFYFVNITTSYTIFHDDVEASLNAWTLILGAGAWLVHAIIIFFAVKKFRSWRWVSFGIIWFYLCHIIESTVIPLELMFEHRNYLPSIGLAIIISAAICKLHQVLQKKELDLGAFAATALLPVIFLGGLIYHVHIWADYRILSSKWAADYPGSLRSQVSFVGMLEGNAMGGVALGKLEEIRQDFDDPHVEISYLIAQCRAEKIVDKLDSNKVAKQNFSSGVLYSLSEAIAFAGPCIEENISGGLMGLIGAVAEMPLLKSKPRYEARYYDIIGDYYVKARLYEPALKARERVWQLQPTEATALKLTELLLLGGDYPLAREYLNKAQELDHKRWYRDRNVELDIIRLSTMLGALEAQQ